MQNLNTYSHALLGLFLIDCVCIDEPFQAVQFSKDLSAPVKSNKKHVHCITLQCSVVKWSVVKPSLVQCGVVQHIAVHCSAVYLALSQKYFAGQFIVV